MRSHPGLVVAFTRSLPFTEGNRESLPRGLAPTPVDRFKVRLGKLYVD
jgi:hypothetical protein